MAEIHDISVSVIEKLEEDEIDIGEGAVALAMSFGRIVSPAVMTPEEEIAFIHAMLDFGSLYFVQGVQN